MLRCGSALQPCRAVGPRARRRGGHRGAALRHTAALRASARRARAARDRHALRGLVGHGAHSRRGASAKLRARRSSCAHGWGGRGAQLARVRSRAASMRATRSCSFDHVGPRRERWRRSVARAFHARPRRGRGRPGGERRSRRRADRPLAGRRRRDGVAERDAPRHARGARRAAHVGGALLGILRAPPRHPRARAPRDAGAHRARASAVAGTSSSCRSRSRTCDAAGARDPRRATTATCRIAQRARARPRLARRALRRARRASAIAAILRDPAVVADVVDFMGTGPCSRRRPRAARRRRTRRPRPCSETAMNLRIDEETATRAVRRDTSRGPTVVGRSAAVEDVFGMFARRASRSSHVGASRCYAFAAYRLDREVHAFIQRFPRGVIAAAALVSLGGAARRRLARACRAARAVFAAPLAAVASAAAVEKLATRPHESAREVTCRDPGRDLRSAYQRSRLGRGSRFSGRLSHRCVAQPMTMSAAVKRVAA